MPTHALLGATGSTGAATLNYLLETKPHDLRLNIFVRNKDKLLSAFPQLEDTKQLEIHIYVAPITKREALIECLRGADVIYNCIADNRSKRGMDIAQQSAAVIIDALKQLQGEDDNYQPPSVLMNRTVYWNRTVLSDMPGFIKSLLGFCLYYPYADIKQAELMYRHEAEQSEPVLNYILMDAPALHDSVNLERTGHSLVVSRDKIGNDLNYADFGAAWVEAAERRKELKNMEVAVSPQGKVRTEYSVLLGYMWQGLLARLLPW